MSQVVSFSFERDGRVVSVRHIRCQVDNVEVELVGHHRSLISEDLVTEVLF